MVVAAFWLSSAAAQKLPFSVLNDVATEIRYKNRNVTDTELARDKAVIDSSYPAITSAFIKKGFTESDAAAATISSWKDLRTQASVVNFEENQFKSYVNKLGKLTI